MNKLFILLAALFSMNAVAAKLPFGPSEEAAILALQSKQLPSSAKGIIRGVWDPSSNTNHGSSTVNSGTQGLGVQLPAGALITDSYGYVVTAPVKSSSSGGVNGTVAFTCEDAGNVLAAKDLSVYPAGTIFSGSARGIGQSTFGGGPSAQGAVASIAAPCELSAVVANQGWSAGKVIMFVEYVIAE